jgi:hypothetical protein
MATEVQDDSLQSFTVPAAARLMGVGAAQVRGWIKRGELFAFLSNTHMDGERVRYRVPTFAIRNFMEKRAAGPAPETPRRTKPVSSRKYF